MLQMFVDSLLPYIRVLRFFRSCVLFVIVGYQSMSLYCNRYIM